jgi:hypothetical protein
MKKTEQKKSSTKKTANWAQHLNWAGPYRARGRAVCADLVGV